MHRVLHPTSFLLCPPFQLFAGPCCNMKWCSPYIVYAVCFRCLWVCGEHYMGWVPFVTSQQYVECTHHTVKGRGICVLVLLCALHASDEWESLHILVTGKKQGVGRGTFAFHAHAHISLISVQYKNQTVHLLHFFALLSFGHPAVRYSLIRLCVFFLRACCMMIGGIEILW